MIRHVVINRMPVAALVPIVAQVPAVPQIPVRPTVPVYTYPKTYWPSCQSKCSCPISAAHLKASGLSAAITVSMGQYVTVLPALLSLSGDADYLQYTDPILDDFQYIQSQVLSVDNNYSTEYHQEYQQVQQVQHQYPQYSNGYYQVVEQPQSQQQLTYVNQVDQMQQQQQPA